MAKLEINGKIVEVDDSFLKLSPQAQQMTVEEIASQMGATQQPAPQQDPNAQAVAAGLPVVDPSMQSDGNSPSPAFQQALAQLHQAAASQGPNKLSMTQNAPQEDTDRQVRANLEATKLTNMQQPGSFQDATAAAQKSALGNFGDEAYSTLVGAPMRMLTDQVGYGEGYKRSQALQTEMDRRREERSPKASLAGNILGGIGGVAAVGPGGLVERGAAALPGVGRFVPGAIEAAAKAAPRTTAIASGLADSAALGSMYEAGDANSGDRLASAGHGALVGLGTGLLGEGIARAVTPLASAGYSAVANAAGKARSVFNPEAEASRRIFNAMKTDAKSAAGVLGPEDIAAASRNNQPIMNLDRGGENTRALARSAANQSPEARGLMEKTVSDRFTNQSGRIVNLMDRITGGQADDLAAQDTLKAAAKAANKPAYDKATNSPAAQRLYTPELQELMQSPAVRKAVKEVEAKSANRAAVEGTKAIKNPFHEASDGSFKLRQTADGTLIAPNLRFWDQVKRNLDDEIGPLQRSGQNTSAADLIGIKNKLVNTLDAAVPEYKAARQGAASFFGAEDALEAGKKFAKSTRMLPEYKRGLFAMKAPERELFQTGFASELIDQAKSSGDRTNVINRMFASPEAREKMRMALTEKGAKEVESFVRVENAMDAARGSFGNSTTARQLVELGLVGGGTWYYTGDLNKGVIVAAGLKGLRYGGHKLDQRVLKSVAELLLSNDPTKIRQLQKLAAASPQYMGAVQAVTEQFARPAIAGGIAGVTGTASGRGQ